RQESRRTTGASCAWKRWRLMIPTQIKIGIGIAIIAALGLMGWQLHRAIERNGKLAAELDASRAQVRAMSAQMDQYRRDAEQDIKARDAATDEARQQAAANARRATELAQQLEEARKDEELSRCLDMRLPDSIRLPE